jgi:hypothetical protein
MTSAMMSIETGTAVQMPQPLRDAIDSYCERTKVG